MIISSNIPVSQESINAMLEEVLSETQKGARAQAESAHQAEQAHLSARIGEMREQAATTWRAGLASGLAGLGGAALSGIGAFSEHNSGKARGFAALADASKATGTLCNAALTHEAANDGIRAEQHQIRANDARFATQTATENAGEARQALDRARTMADRNEETRHATNSLWRG